jgi:hypothetical protein
MKSFYSVIRFVSNQWSNENIAVGLLVVTTNNFFFRISNRKMQIAKKLNPDAGKLLKFSIDQLDKFIESEKNKIQEKLQISLSLEKIQLDHAFIKRMHQYNQGVLQISEPELINKEFDQASFDSYFKKIVDQQEEQIKNPVIQSEFRRKIETKLYKPLAKRVDVNYEIKKNQLESLYYDFTFDNIGVNGALIGSASIDINKPVGNLRSKLAEYEGIVDRLIKYAASKGIGSNHKFFLIADPYKGNHISNQELDSMLKGTVNDKFERITTAEINKIIREVKEKKASKFSELFEE